MGKMIRRNLYIMLAVALAYLLFWPVPVEPVAWESTPTEGYVGPYAPNDRLAGLERIEIMGRHGPEDAAAGPDGSVYVTTGEGDILRFPPDGGPEVFATIEGRPLGIEVASDGTVWVADAMRGLLRVTEAGAEMVAETTVAGDVIAYPNSLDFAPDGAIWLSDSSTRFPARDWGGTLEASYLEILEHGRSGRILRVDPETGAAEVRHEGIAYANGVAMGASGEWLLYVETGENAVRRLWIDGPRAGEVENILTNLPGFPDNIKRDVDGGFLLGLVSKRAPLVDMIAPYPFLRKIVQRLPASIRPKAQSYGFIIRLSPEGELEATWQDPSGAYPLTTGAVRGADGAIWVTSLSAGWLGRLKTP